MREPRMSQTFAEPATPAAAETRKPNVVILATGGTAVMYLLFVELLGVPFPDGLVDAVIGG